MEVLKSNQKIPIYFLYLLTDKTFCLEIVDRMYRMIEWGTERERKENERSYWNNIGAVEVMGITKNQFGTCSRLTEDKKGKGEK